MNERDTLTTTQAAKLAAVAPSTVKRWADQGILPSTRTAGGHRRFERSAVERFLRGLAATSPADDAPIQGWIRCLIGQRRHEIDGRLLEARWRLGAWYRVADELGGVLTGLGEAWARGHVSVAQEHLASEALARALGRVGESLPASSGGPRCVLSCPGEEEHTLGLSLAELCLRELGWTSVWLGRRTPPEEVVRVVAAEPVAMVALSASAWSSDPERLAETVAEIGAACRERGADLVLGGQGAWPAAPPCGVRLDSFAALRGHLS